MSQEGEEVVTFRWGRKIPADASGRELIRHWVRRLPNCPYTSLELTPQTTVIVVATGGAPDVNGVSVMHHTAWVDYRDTVLRDTMQYGIKVKIHDGRYLFPRRWWHLWKK